MNRFSSILSCRIPRSDLSFMGRKRSQNFVRLLFGHLEAGERSFKLSCNLIELRGRNPKVTVSDFQANRGTARFRGRVLKWPACYIANPQRAHEFQARKPAQIVGVPLAKGRVL